MGYARCVAMLLLGYRATCGRAFVVRPRLGPVKCHVTRHRNSIRRAPRFSKRLLVASSLDEAANEVVEPLGGLEKASAGEPWSLLPKAAVPVLAAVGAWAAAASIAGAADTFAGGAQMPLALSQLLADPAASLAANPEWTRYAFMFPIGVVVATCAQTAGIGGAAIMGPFLLLGLPLLGPSYPLHSVAASVATAILCEAFGFSSGLFGYYRRGLVDSGSAIPFILASLPACLLGAVIVPYADERVLKALYAVFMLGLSVYLLLDDEASESLIPEECSVEELESGEVRAICSSDGEEYIYKRPDFGAESGFSTAFGGLMTGMLGVGIGEVVIPQLVKKNGVPLPVAAGTSVLVVFLNAVVAAGTQIGGIISQGGEDIPWNLIAFIIPGVIIGGQLAPRLQGRLSQKTMERILAGVFGVIGVTFTTISVESLMAVTSASAALP